MEAKQVKEILARCNVEAFNLLSRSALAIGPDEVARQLLRENPFFGSIDIVIPYQEDARWDDVQMPIDMRFDDDEERSETLKDWQMGFAKYISEITPARDEIIMMAVALAEALARAETAEAERDEIRASALRIVEARVKCNRYAMSDDWSQDAITATVELSMAISAADELLNKREER